MDKSTSPATSPRQQGSSDPVVMSEQPTSTQRLLSSPNCELSENARADLESGRVDVRLVDAMLALAQEYKIAISAIKTGHPMGATTPAGRPNAHFYYRAVDVISVDGRLIAEDPDSPALLHVGRILHGLSPERRPDRIMGPAAWQQALNYPVNSGFVSDPFHNEIHADHLHIGFSDREGTDNRD